MASVSILNFEKRHQTPAPRMHPPKMKRNKRICSALDINMPKLVFIILLLVGFIFLMEELISTWIYIHFGLEV
jgi:hypothetical protein